ncbi:response regulator [Deinococcus malanensis]|uniref:response regulator n=1 Tax=Deinococcus malanensis TaxID=1706855 RepID=UPI003644F71A
MSASPATTLWPAFAIRRPLPDLIVLDINMPGMDGFDVLEAIKADPGLVHLPVVMLSASDNPADVTRAYSLRASAYVVKAHDFATFLQQIDALVGFWTLCRVSGKPLRAQGRGL